MPEFKDYSFISCNGKTPVHVRRCQPDGEVRGVIQLAHGIAEHVNRYDRFAEFLANEGYLVVANDHLGHGQSILSEDDLGFFADNSGWEIVVGDMNKLHTMTAEEYPGVPYFLFGHSMGSFLARTYIIRYRTGLSGAIICGTGQQGAALVAGGLFLGKREIKKNGPRHKSTAINNLAFGSYNKAFEPNRTEYDWLSRDNDKVDAYVADPLCGFMASVGLFTDMMGGIKFITNQKNVQRMNMELPILFVAGDKDPVGDFGKGVTRCYESFLKAGVKDATLKLYHDCRHEILNELNYQEVQNDILTWVESKR